MAAIVDFKDRETLNKYIASNSNGEILGRGTEGTCYRGFCGKAYKVFQENGYREFYPVDSIITHDEVPLKSFAFPQIIFTVNGEIEAYSYKIVEQNLFDNLNFSSIININFDKLIEAYKLMITEIYYLSSQGIVINDLPNNLLFDGESLIAVDTISYQRNNDTDFSFSVNYRALEEVIRSTFDVLFEDDESENIFIDYSQDTISFLRDIETKFKNNRASKTYVYK